MSTSQQAITSHPTYRLFDARAVGLAALICTPLAGALLIAVNYSRLGKARKAALAILFALIATAILIVIKWNAPSLIGTVGASALGFLGFLCTWQIALEIQGDAIDDHLTSGGRLASKWTALFVGIASLAALYAVICAILFALQERSITIETRNTIVYSGLATKSNATALGNQLKSAHYFEDHGATIYLYRSLATRTLSFVVPDGVWNQSGILSTFEDYARQVGPSIGGFPIDIELIDTEKTVKAKSTVNQLRFGNHNLLYYQGEVTKDDAEQLSQSLEASNLFRSNNTTVLFTRHNGEGTTITFIVGPHSWTNPQTITDLETTLRNAGPAIGGLPLQMHLVNANLDLQKEDLIEPQ
jgi:hypothetical protein